MNQIKAIETRYKGCNFRSRLEARWAVFFDTLGIEWQYEPQGFELVPYVGDPDNPWDSSEPSHLGYYLPDFLLPTVGSNGTWFEVKGRGPDYDGGNKAQRLSALTKQRVFVAWGDMPAMVDDYGYMPGQGSAGFTRDIELNGGEDYNYAWCICPACGRPGIAYEGRGDRVCGIEAVDRSPEGIAETFRRRCTGQLTHYVDRGHNANNTRLLAAYAAARSARFEHGQSGAT
jgi:hypothetical protein